jgi:hypothetical protein
MTLLESPVGSRMMAIDDNFVSVLPTVLVDPVLKLRLEQGRWNPESSGEGGSVDLALSYDPELRPDRLIMPIPEKRRKLLEILGPVQKDWTVFESEASRQIAKIIVAIHDKGDEVRLEFISSVHSLEVTAELLAREGGHQLAADPYQLLLYMFRSAIFMEDWDESYAVPWGARSISFCTSPEVAEKLAAETGAEFERTPDDMALIASRAVRS